MLSLSAMISREKEILRLRSENKQLLRQNNKLQEQNNSMRQGMRRCLSCDYRLDFKKRQGVSTPD